MAVEGTQSHSPATAELLLLEMTQRRKIVHSALTTDNTTLIVVDGIKNVSCGISTKKSAHMLRDTL